MTVQTKNFILPLSQINYLSGPELQDATTAQASVFSFGGSALESGDGQDESLIAAGVQKGGSFDVLSAEGELYTLSSLFDDLGTLIGYMFEGAAPKDGATLTFLAHNSPEELFTASARSAPMMQMASMSGDGTVNITVNSTIAHVGFADAQGDMITNGDDHIVIANTVGAATIYAGGGDDFIDDTARTTAPRIFVFGGAGSDTIIGGIGGGYYATGGLHNNPLQDILDSEDDVNVIRAGAGNDILWGEGGQDILDGGAGNDIIYGFGAQGTTLAFGGAGDDVIYADYQNRATASSNGGDLRGGAGNDRLYGSAANDTLNGGSGDDVMTGRGGADKFIWSGADRGNDIITDFGTGADTVDLSAIFNMQTLGNYNAVHNTSFSSPLDALNHHLRISSATVSVAESVERGDARTYTGRQITFNGVDNTGPTLLFNGLVRDLTHIETNVLCFMEGTRIQTATGEVAVEDLKAGDLLRTASGETPLLWLGRKTMQRARLRTRDYPVCLSAGSLGQGLPRQDLYVSADHGMRVGDFVVNAGALVNGSSIRHVALSDVPETFTYYHIETLAHDEIYANGALSETFIDYVGRSAFDNYADYLERFGADRLICEMRHPRLSSQRQLPAALRQEFGLYEESTAEIGQLLRA